MANIEFLNFRNGGDGYHVIVIQPVPGKNFQPRFDRMLSGQRYFFKLCGDVRQF